jgi:stearoyl-CoA desaturase (delta-9 desaturase)
MLSRLELKIRNSMMRDANLNWGNVLVLLLSPIAAISALGCYIWEQGLRCSDVICLAAMTTLTGLAITAGYHRYYSHKTYDCDLIVQIFYLVFGAAALQAPVITWASEHRDHHRFVDQDRDPYCAKRGFFWAHVGWIMRRADSRSFENVADLHGKPFVLAQERFHVALGLIVGFGLPFLIGLSYDRPWGSVLWGGLVRVVIAHHGTFLVNSVGHYFGRQPYSCVNTSRDNSLLAILTLGEGYHNFHHAFPGDYRNGVRWYHWDPTKWWIFLLRVFGLARQLKRTPEVRIRQAVLRNLGTHHE